MAESSVSRHRSSLRTRLAQNVQGFLFFVSLWSAESSAAIVRRRNRRTSYKIKRGHVRYANKWIPLQKFRALQVLPSSYFSFYSALVTPGFFLLCGFLFPSVNGLVLFGEPVLSETLLHVSVCGDGTGRLLYIIIFFLFFYVRMSRMLFNIIIMFGIAL